MSEYQEYVKERDQIDFLIQNGYRVKYITENLDGALVEFEKSENSSERKKEILNILTPNARKYLSAKLLGQQKETNSVL
ncbi:hypothetical protein D1953_15840 [Peribacillus asahii]|uniref:Uncharacterized protein n=1 Tax=Peribacillus asahii TaxID=228899 RepID=A0A398B744_9BACI|nr:hypothetical protein [Peribacillus asahii]RID83536.1 hypothetical protein D1953_15840 [Peribacillus asahii]